MGKNRKISGATPKSGKRIKSPADLVKPSSDVMPPIFSMRHIEKDYCISKCTKDEKVAFTDTLHKLSQIPWKEIRQAPRHGLGYEKIARNSIKASVPNHITEPGFFYYPQQPNAPRCVAGVMIDLIPASRLNPRLLRQHQRDCWAD